MGIKTINYKYIYLIIYYKILINFLPNDEDISQKVNYISYWPLNLFFILSKSWYSYLIFFWVSFMIINFKIKKKLKE